MTIHAGLSSARNGLQMHLGRIDAAAAAGRLTDVDARRSYAGAFVEFYSKTENAIEDLMIGAIMGRITFSSSQIRPLVSISSEQVVRKVVFGSRNYADWIPYDQTRRRARTFLSRGQPFTSLSKTERNFLDSLGTIRNALAHEGGYALRRFREEFTDGLALPPIQRRPSGFLRGQYSVGTTRFDYLSARALGVIRTLCNQ